MALPQNVIDELKAWLSDISQTWHFKGGGETGIDIGMHGKIDTPIYSVSSGKVIGSGYYGGGGVVSIQSNINYGGITGPASIYYQHLDQVLVPKGSQVYQGELIGLSGGQLSGGSHPSSSQFSNGPHIEIGINAPYGQANKSIWSPLGQNVNPQGFFESLLAGNTNVLMDNTGGGPPPTPQQIIDAILAGLGVATNSIVNGPAAAASNKGPSNPLDIAGAIASLPQNIANSIGNGIKQGFSNLGNSLGISGVSDIAWRALFIILGSLLMLGAVIFIGLDLLDKSNVEVAGTRV